MHFVIPIRDTDGLIQYFLTLGLPITERKFHDSLQEHILRLLEAIAFRASHQIRGLSDLIRKKLIDANEFNTAMVLEAFRK